MSSRTALSGLLFAGMLSCLSLANASSYTYTDLGTPGGDYSFANAINNSGQIAGVAGTGYATAGGTANATLWNGTAATNLATQGLIYSYANAINNFGQVAGNALFSYGGYNATSWNGSAATNLGSLSYTANGINDLGQIVGVSAFNGGQDANGHARFFNHAALWNGATTIDLGTLAGRTARQLPSIILAPLQGLPI